MFRLNTSNCSAHSYTPSVRRSAVPGLVLSNRTFFSDGNAPCYTIQHGSHPWPSSAWNVARATEELNFSSCVVLAYVNLKNHMWLMATSLHSMDLDSVKKRMDGPQLTIIGPDKAGSSCLLSIHVKQSLFSSTTFWASYFYYLCLQMKKQRLGERRVNSYIAHGEARIQPGLWDPHTYIATVAQASQDLLGPPLKTGWLFLWWKILGYITFHRVTSNLTRNFSFWNRATKIGDVSHLGIF